MSVNYELYKVFYHAAKYMNFSKAANDLFITQSAVSQSIKQLETQLNTKLFLRHGRAMQLTNDGDILYKHIQQAYFLISAGEKQLSAHQNLEAGELRIGASDTICKYFLLPYIEAFHKQYPGIKLQIVNRPSPAIHRLVEESQVEIGVVNILPEYTNPKLEVKPVIRFKDIFIASNEYLSLAHGRITLDELSQYPLISLGKNSTTRIYFNKLVKTHRLNYEPEIELGSIDLIIEMVKIGLGVGFVSDYAVKNDIAQGNVFKIQVDARIPERQIGIIHASNLHLSAAGKAFKDLFKAL